MSSPELNRLRQFWKQWSAVVQLVAMRRRSDLQPMEYLQLHRDMRTACRDLLKADPSLAALCEEMLHASEPWLSLDSLKHADPLIQVEVANHCALLSERLSPGRLKSRAKVVLVGVFGLLGLGVLSFLILSWAPHIQWTGIDTSPLSRLVRFCQDNVYLAVGIGVAFFASLLLLHRTRT